MLNKLAKNRLRKAMPQINRTIPHIRNNTMIWILSKTKTDSMTTMQTTTIINKARRKRRNRIKEEANNKTKRKR